MNRSKPALSAVVILAAAAFLSLPAASSAQKTTTTTTTPQGVTKEVNIDIATVVYASGDDAVLKTPDGRLRLFAALYHSVRLVRKPTFPVRLFSDS